MTVNRIYYNIQQRGHDVTTNVMQTYVTVAENYILNPLQQSIEIICVDYTDATATDYYE